MLLFGVVELLYSSVPSEYGNARFLEYENSNDSIAILLWVTSDELQKQDGDGLYVYMPRVHCDHFSNKLLQLGMRSLSVVSADASAPARDNAPKGLKCRTTGIVSTGKVLRRSPTNSRARIF
jgi:hypothetical protein